MIVDAAVKISLALAPSIEKVPVKVVPIINLYCNPAAAVGKVTTIPPALFNKYVVPVSAAVTVLVAAVRFSTSVIKLLTPAVCARLPPDH